MSGENENIALIKVSPKKIFLLYLNGINFRGNNISRMAMEDTNTFRGKKFSRMKQFFGQFSLFLCQFGRFVLKRFKNFAGDK